MTIAGLKLFLNKKLWNVRKKILQNKYSSLAGGNSEISIFSQNCIGGLVMNELNMQFMSPLVNCYMDMPDFVSFCENMDHYLNVLPTEIKQNERTYPVCILEDLKIYAVHYKTGEEFAEAWRRRSQRVNKDKIFLIMTDRDGFSEALLDRIEALPYKKVLFSHIDYSNYEFVHKIPGYENDTEIGSITNFIGITGKRIYSHYAFADVFMKMIETDSVVKEE